MADFIKAVIYGLIEGITEWLPISSTGHLILIEKLLPFENVSEGFFDMFDVVIQLGAILAVVLLYWNRLWPFAFTKKQRDKGNYKTIFKTDLWLMWAKILVACLPAAIVGLLFDDWCNEHFYNYICVSIALIVFGILFIVVENLCKNREFKINSVADIDFCTALCIGIFQLLAAVFPGTSRSGATIIGALIIGVARGTAAEFTFFLAVPVMLGASLLKVVKFGFDFTGTETAILLIGSVVSFAVSIGVLKFLVGYIRKHDFKVFGWYRIALGAIVLAMAFM